MDGLYASAGSQAHAMRPQPCIIQSPDARWIVAGMDWQGGAGIAASGPVCAPDLRTSRVAQSPFFLFHEGRPMDKAQQNMTRVMERILQWCKTTATPEPQPDKKPPVNVKWVLNPDGSRSCIIKRTPPQA